MIHDGKRPAFHFTVRSGWMNDPHGITWRGDHYETFFQYVPGAIEWGPGCHWGHAVGEDLLSLRELAPVLLPGDGEDGAWSGCLVDDGHEPRIFYTATNLPEVGRGRVRVATALGEDWTSWAKGAVVAELPAGLGIVNFRDPFIMRDGDRWRMLVGAGDDSGTAMVVSYTSPDLEAWSYDRVMISRSSNETDSLWTGSLWECPQLLELDGKHVLVFSVWHEDQLHYAAYAVGELKDGALAVENWGRLTHGPSYYAPSLFRDASGRPALTFWLRGVSDAAAGWAGAHSVPHLLALEGGRLVATPHPDLAKHRAEPHVPEAGAMRIDGPAELDWDSSAGDELSLSRGGAKAALVRQHGRELEVAVADQTWRLPSSGPVRLVLDGQPWSSPHAPACFPVRFPR